MKKNKKISLPLGRSEIKDVICTIPAAWEKVTSIAPRYALMYSLLVPTQTAY